MEYIRRRKTSRCNKSSNKVNKFSTYSGQQISNITNLANVNNSTGGFLRFSSNIKELDRVLGGGLVTGSVIILGGDLEQVNLHYY